jgi:hypothetical protein
VSCSWNAWAPDSVVEFLRRISSTDASKIAVPVRRVLANAVSSASMTVWMLAETLLSSGYSPLIASRATEVSSCMKRSPVAGVAPAPPR